MTGHIVVCPPDCTAKCTKVDKWNLRRCSQYGTPDCNITDDPCCEECTSEHTTCHLATPEQVASAKLRGILK